MAGVILGVAAIPAHGGRPIRGVVRGVPEAEARRGHAASPGLMVAALLKKTLALLGGITAEMVLGLRRFPLVAAALFDVTVGLVGVPAAEAQLEHEASPRLVASLGLGTEPGSHGVPEARGYSRTRGPCCWRRS